MADSNALLKFFETIPSSLKPRYNTVLLALITALARSDDEIETQIQNGRDQLFVKTATGTNLESLAKSRGVSKPATLGLTDDEFRELIPNLSLKPKQIKKAFYDTADVFWGPLFSRANLTSNNAGPYDVSVGDSISVKIDGGETQVVKVLAGEIATDGAATAEEIKAILERIDNVTVTILEDLSTGDKSVNLRTNTPGPVGSVEILSSTMVSSTKLDFDLGKVEILDLAQRVAVYNINPNELLIEIPAIVPTLRRTLKGSHHFHADATLEPPVPPSNDIWSGSFLFNPTGTRSTFTLTSQRATLQQPINQGEVYTSILVDDTSLFDNPSGQIVFGFGTEKEEVPVTYRGIPNSNTLLLDPGYVFENDHAIGTSINVTSAQVPHVPERDGTDLAVYLTSPSGAREIVQEIIQKLKAAGIIIKFEILAPNYKYLCDNPYISDDDAPSI